MVTGATNLGFCAPHLEALAKARSASKSIMPILQRRPVIDTDVGGLKLGDKLEDIEFKDVHFTYPARPNVKVRISLFLLVYLLTACLFKVNLGKR